jgi:hypothetical protein
MHAASPAFQFPHLLDRVPRIPRPIASTLTWLLVVGLGCAAITPASAGSIYWDMQTLAATSNDVAGLVAGDLTRGNGGISTITGTLSSSSGYSFLLDGTSTPASGGNNSQSSALGGPLVTGSSAYFAISLSNTSSYAMTIVSVGFGSRSTGTGPASYALRSSLDGYTTDIAGGTGTLPTTSTWAYYTNSFATPLEITPGGAEQLRLYGYGGSAINLNNQIWRIDDLQVVVVPEPSAAGSLVGLLAVCLAAVARSRAASVRQASRT